MTPVSLAGHFIDGSRGRIFVLARAPARPHGCVLVLPPFAEEMNKCRRMVSQACLGLAACGVASLVVDLYGTGDSGGDFGDADWAGWREDAGRAAQWAAQQGLRVTGLLAIRLGGALAVQSVEAGQVAPVARTVLWQPVFDGARHLTQFLRLRTAASLMEDRKETVSELRGRLKGGEVVEVAGYALAPRLAAELDAIAVPERLPQGFGETCWMELCREEGAEWPAPATRLLENSRSAGQLVHGRTFVGEPFWTSTEIVVNEAVIEATVGFFTGAEAEHA